MIAKKLYTCPPCDARVAERRRRRQVPVPGDLVLHELARAFRGVERRLRETDHGRGHASPPDGRHAAEGRAVDELAYELSAGSAGSADDGGGEALTARRGGGCVGACLLDICSCGCNMISAIGFRIEPFGRARVAGGLVTGR